MSSTRIEVASTEQLIQAVRGGGSFVVVGGGSKPDLVRVARATQLQVEGLRGIVEYLPEEYTITAWAGTPLAELERALAEHGQYLPFDAPYANDGATVGGAVAAGLNGPGRMRYGGLRDFVLGVRLVDGRGRLIRGGGKVVKNAAGFDLPKLLVGSCGSLGVLTEVTLKVFPAPPSFATLVWTTGSRHEATTLHQSAAHSGLQLDGLALLSDGRLAARVGGRPEALPARLERLRSAVSPIAEELAAQDELAFWTARRDAKPSAGGSLVRVPLTLDRVAATVDLLDTAVRDSNGWWQVAGGGSLAWASVDAHLLPPLVGALRDTSLQAQVVAGDRVGRCGAAEPSVLESQVRSVLDPQGLFVSPGLAVLEL